MADFVYKFDQMRTAAQNIDGIASRYEQAASTLESDFLAAIASWEGDTKEAMQRFVSGPVMEYTHDTVPKLLNAMAELLRANADQMEKADHQIAENIPTTLG